VLLDEFIPGDAGTTSQHSLLVQQHGIAALVHLFECLHLAR
jgi:hypothetical protein